jgi:glucose-6-phosphate isomerase
VLDNVIRTRLVRLFDFLDWDRTLVNVVSKSGGTAETAATYLMARGLLEERFASAPEPSEAVRSHLVFTTDPCRGVLREIAREEGIAAFAIPPGWEGGSRTQCRGAATGRNVRD